MINSERDNPWSGIPIPSHRLDVEYQDLATRLIPYASSDEVTTCWAVLPNGHRALLIMLPLKYRPAPMPKLRSINVAISVNGHTRQILLELLVGEVFMQFQQLCLDVVDVVNKSEPDELCWNIKTCLEKWRYLLRPMAHMSEESQKGLIAELLFLESFALERLTPEGALRSWTGPLRDPRDFSFGTTFVEVKSNRGSKHPFIKVSSENQLSISQSETLYLFVVGLDEAPDRSGTSITEQVKHTRNLLSGDFSALQELEIRLAAYGFRDEEDYGDKSWKESSRTCYRVVDGFPRLQSGDLPYGIGKVKYEIDLRYCREYLTSDEALLEAIGK